MSLEAAVMVGIGLLIGVMVVLLGAVATIRGFSSARNAYLALAADETDLDDFDADEETATVKLSGTVESVPEPVETADGRQAALYNLKVVAKNWRNVLSKRRDRKWLLAEGARLKRAVVGGDGGRWELTAEPVDENRRWGGVQEDTASGYGSALKRPDTATGEWTTREKHTDDADVPDHVREYLASEYDTEIDVDVSASLVSLTVAEDIVEAGDEIRIVGKVQPGQPPEQAAAAAAPEAAADGGDAPVSVNLTPGATVTGGSWRTLAWAETKSAVKAPVGLLLVAMGVAVPLLMAVQAGLVDLGLGL